MLVTAESPKGSVPPAVSAADVILHGNKSELKVEDLVPLKGDQAALQLAILIDDGSETTLSLQFPEIKAFIRKQGPAAQVGVYYIRNGSAIAAKAMTADLDAAANSLRMPLGQPGIAVSPYLAISEFVKKWPATAARREILLISPGIDLYTGAPYQNPYLASCIDDAQRAGVLIHSIYSSGSGHAGHDYFWMNFGRDNLSFLGDRTGGESYWEGLATSVTFQPYLDDLSARLTHQYLLTLTAPPARKGRFEQVRLRTEIPHVDLVSADRVWFPGDK